jgi:hypothetical protein
MGVHQLSQSLMRYVEFHSMRPRQVSQRTAGVSPVLVQRTSGEKSEERARSSWVPAYDENLAMSGTRQDGLVLAERWHLREACWFWSPFEIRTTATEYTVALGEYGRYEQLRGRRGESLMPIP